MKVHPHFRVGAYAATGISKEDLYLSVPSSIIMDADKAFNDNTSFGTLAKNLEALYGARDNFHELLFYLLHQRFMADQDSVYWPYLQILPNKDELDLPLYWTHKEIESRLTPSSILPATLAYALRTRNTFEKILTIDLITSFFPSNVLTLDNYLWAVSILDSRSIWWNGHRHLVPMLDLINCKDGPVESAQSYRVHATVLSDGGNEAITYSPYDFQENEEVFENYGQPNHIYFQYHGFTLSQNNYDCVQFVIDMTEEEIGQLFLLLRYFPSIYLPVSLPISPSLSLSTSLNLSHYLLSLTFHARTSQVERRHADC